MDASVSAFLDNGIIQFKTTNVRTKFNKDDFCNIVEENNAEDLKKIFHVDIFSEILHINLVKTNPKIYNRDKTLRRAENPTWS